VREKKAGKEKAVEKERKRKAKCRFVQNKIPFANCAQRRFMLLLFKLSHALEI
jgi:hypothetical protein